MHTKVQKYLYFVLISVFLLYFVSSVSAYAEELNPISSPKNVWMGNSVEINEKTKEDLFVSGNHISLMQGADENAFLLGSNIEVTQKAKANMFIIGNEIQISGDINESLFVVGGNIQIEGDIDEDIYAIGDVVMIKGNVDDDVYISATQVYINDGVKIDGNININASVVKIFHNVESSGYVNINGSNDLDKFRSDDLPVDIKLVKPVSVFNLSMLSIGLVAIIGEALLGVLMFRYFRKQMDRVQGALTMDKANIVSNLKNGFLAYAILIFGSIIGVISLIGIPFVSFGIAIYTVLSYVVKSSIAYKLGQTFTQKFMKKDNVFLNLLLGYLVLVLGIALIAFIPVVGEAIVALVTIFIYVLGMGAVIGQIKLVLPQMNEKRD